MRAIAFKPGSPGAPDGELFDTVIPDPVATGRDLLVSVMAVSVNPVDLKVRQRAAPGGDPQILGWDASGIVTAIGADVTLFRVGDAVAYAGTIARPGSNAQFQLVDERIVGRKPASLDWARAAALPLTGITASEMLFERLDVRRPVAGAAAAVLVIGGAGGVGSIAIQLLRALTDLCVIASASRPDTRDWVREMGAHHVVDHSRPLAPQIAALGIGAPGFVFSTTHSGQHLADIAELIAPQGRLGMIDDPAVVDILPFKRKSVSVHWELMFTRSVFQTPDMAEQGGLLDQVADLVDAGRLRTTLSQCLSPINAANLARAHAMVDAGTMCGKVVLEGWE